MLKSKSKRERVLDKVVDFGKKLLTSVLRSRTGALTELAKLLRFQKGTKGFEREYNKLIPLIKEIKGAFKLSIFN